MASTPFVLSRHHSDPPRAARVYLHLPLLMIGFLVKLKIDPKDSGEKRWESGHA
ncbi:hypothetical protein [Sphingopyxis sp.]|uniref:hypothetical protein n=1 Tax=Sphingopyxis sp. TaxID=1908224 RepID=UPI003D107F06